MRTLASFILFAAAVRAQDTVAFVSRDARSALLQPGGEPVTLSFTADPGPEGGDIFHSIVSQPGPEIVLVTPSGAEVNASNAEAQGFLVTTFSPVSNSAYFSGPAAIPGFHTFIELPAGAPAGEYKIKAIPARLEANATVQSFYTSSSPVRVAIAAGKSAVRAGEPVAFSAMIYEGPVPLAGAAANLRIRSADDLAAPPDADLLLPDSGELDATTGDGLYLGLWTPQRPGRYTAALKVTGISNSGIAYSRMATTEVTVLPALARFESIGDSAIDDNGDGISDRVVVAVRLNVSTAGRYQLLLNLRSANRFLTARPVFTLEAGAARIEAGFRFEDLADLGADGPYSITDVFLLHLDSPNTPTADEIADAGRTGAYVVSQLAGAKPLSAGATSLAFGDVVAGGEKTLDLTLRNAAPYPFTQPVLRVSNEAFAVVAPGIPVTVPANGTLALTVRFRPPGLGAYTGTLTIAGLTVSLNGNGVAAPSNPSPRLVGVSPSSAVAGGQAFTLAADGENFVATSVIRWNGAARTTTFLSSTRLTAAITAVDIVSAGTAQITVFTPAPGGGTSSALSFAITSTVTPVPAIEISPAATAGLDFGSVTVGQTKDLTLTVRNTGNGALSINSFTSSNGRFTVRQPASMPFTVNAGSSTAVIVQFSPAAAGSQTGILTIASNDPARPSVTVPMAGTGISAPAAREVTLLVDDGSFEIAMGSTAGGARLYFVNRLTPASYPASLKKIQIYFGAEPDDLPAGHPITFLAAPNTSGASNLNAITFQQMPSVIAARDRFNEFTLATPLTIKSGDFVVGFSTISQSGVYPMVIDQSSPSRQRSYYSVDGVNFAIVDSVSRDLAGNFGIRAVVDVPVP